MPDKYKLLYEQKYGDPVELLKQQQMKSKLKLDEKARQYFEAFEYDLNGVQTHLSERLKSEYTINASVLNLLSNQLNDRIAFTKALNNSPRRMWETITGSCENLRETYGHTLPNSFNSLKDCITRYKEKDYRSLISGKIGNENTLKISEEAGRMLIALKRSRMPAYNDQQIFEKFNILCEQANGCNELLSRQFKYI